MQRVQGVSQAQQGSSVSRPFSLQYRSNQQSMSSISVVCVRRREGVMELFEKKSKHSTTPAHRHDKHGRTHTDIKLCFFAGEQDARCFSLFAAVSVLGLGPLPSIATHVSFASATHRGPWHMFPPSHAYERRICFVSSLLTAAKSRSSNPLLGKLLLSVRSLSSYFAPASIDIKIQTIDDPKCTQSWLHS